MSDIGSQPLVGREAEADLARRIHSGDEKAWQLLITANLRFVVSIAKRYVNRGVPLADLINEGNLGLIRAARRFDESRGVRFVSYAVWWVRQAILQAIAEQSRIVRVPLGRVEQANRYSRVSRSLGQRLGRQPTEEELAVEIGVSVAAVSETLAVPRAYVSLDAPVSGAEDTPLLELLPDRHTPGPQEEVADHELRLALESSLTLLESREAAIVRCYFGLDGEPQTLEQIGRNLGVSRERVRQIKDEALVHLRHGVTSRSLRTFLMED